MWTSTIDHIRTRLNEPLPGLEAHRKMASERAIPYLEKHTTQPPDARLASVMMLLFPENGRLRTTLIKRAPHPQDHHSGQVSFPGGSREKGESPEWNALRETEEEIGVRADKIELLGSLSPIYIFASNFWVNPFVGFVQGRPDFILQPNEVVSVLTPELSHFYRKDLLKTTDISIGEQFILPNVPYFDVDGHVVWGATAMMLAEFSEVIDEKKL